MANGSFERRGDATATHEDVARHARNELSAYVVRAAPMRDFDPLLRRAVRRALPVSMRTRLRLVATDLVAPRERRRAARAARRPPLRLHLGSAETFKPGWVNVDLVAATGQVDVAWNLLRPLPFPDASVEAIFHEHVLEHFPLAKGDRKSVV